LFLLLGGYLLMAIILSIVSTHPKTLDCSKDKEIYVATNGVHLEVIIQKKDLDTTQVQALQIGPQTNFVSFGWGDRAFYINTPDWGDLKLTTAINALFLNSKSTIHVTNYSQKKEDWVSVPVCEEQITLLTAYIDNEFATNDENELLEIKASGYTVNDTFYEANGSYNCIQTCNTWVNVGLKRAHIKTSIWSPFDKGVLYQLKK